MISQHKKGGVVDSLLLLFYVEELQGLKLTFICFLTR